MMDVNAAENRESNIINFARYRKDRDASSAGGPDVVAADALVGNAGEEVAGSHRPCGEAVHGITSRIDEALVLLDRAATSGRRVVDNLDAVIAHAGRTSAFNRECQKAVEQAEAVFGPEQLEALEAVRDELAEKLAGLLVRA